MTAPPGGAVGRAGLAVALAVSVTLAGCGGGGHASGATTSPTATTLPPNQVAFAAKARALGALGPDDELLLLGLSVCSAADKGPIDGYVQAQFHGLNPGDRQQAALVFMAAASDLCPAHADALNQAAAQVVSLS